MKRIIVATGIPEYDSGIKKIEGYNFVNINIGFKSELFEACINYKPDIIIVSEKLSGEELLSGIAIDIKQKLPNIRIIYLAGAIDLSNVNKVNNLGAMVLAGIFDIVTERRVNKGLIKHILEIPKEKNEVEYLLRYFLDKKKDAEINMEFEEDIDEEEIEDDFYKNVFMVSSIKPGTGKSFVSTNIATCLAKYGQHINGNPPKIAIIEADLQTLSVGTLLAIEDDKHNLKTVMDKISTIITPEGDLVNDDIKLNEVNEYIINAFKPYSKCKNLFALVGSQLGMEEIEGVSPFYYSYLIDIVSQKFDYVVIDSNSSLLHVTTFPLLSMVNKSYYILNLDFNNARNNMRYRHTLKNLGVYDKVRYVLNEDLTDNPDNIEKLQFDSNVLSESFELEAKIPIIQKSIFMNRLWQGTPIILDDTQHTLKARYELSKIANQIHKIENLDWLAKECAKLENSNTKKRGLFSR